jgi:hypothetical protein
MVDSKRGGCCPAGFDVLRFAWNDMQWVPRDSPII